jgi:hypothetical protein
VRSSALVGHSRVPGASSEATAVLPHLSPTIFNL